MGESGSVRGQIDTAGVAADAGAADAGVADVWGQRVPQHLSL